VKREIGMIIVSVIFMSRVAVVVVFLLHLYLVAVVAATVIVVVAVVLHITSADKTKLIQILVLYFSHFVLWLSSRVLGSISPMVYTQLLRVQISKAQKGSQVITHLALLGSRPVKAGRKHVGEIKPRGHFHQFFYKKLLCKKIPKAQKGTDVLTCLCALLGSSHVKALSKHVDEINHPSSSTMSSSSLSSF